MPRHIPTMTDKRLWSSLPPAGTYLFSFALIKNKKKKNPPQPEKLTNFEGPATWASGKKQMCGRTCLTG